MLSIPHVPATHITPLQIMKTSVTRTILLAYHSDHTTTTPLDPSTCYPFSTTLKVNTRKSKVLQNSALPLPNYLHHSTPTPPTKPASIPSLSISPPHRHLHACPCRWNAPPELDPKTITLLPYQKADKRIYCCFASAALFPFGWAEMGIPSQQH